MPFYSYSCSSCNKIFKSFHSSDECESACIICKSSSIVKLIPNVRTVEKLDKKAGERVEKFIEESKEVLQQQMADARKDFK